MLAGGEILKDSRTNTYTIWNHARAVDIRKFQNQGGRMRGNMEYKEDKWYVNINPLNIKQNNEPDWSECTMLTGTSDVIPVEITQSVIPDEILQAGAFSPPPSFYAPNTVLADEVPYRGITTWNEDDVRYSEVKIKDKWIRIRIRYSGKKLAIIHSVQTLFNII